jgi:hypothetical protein
MLTEQEYQNLFALLKSGNQANIDIVRSFIQSIEDVDYRYTVCEDLSLDYMNSFPMEIHPCIFFKYSTDAFCTMIFINFGYEPGFHRTLYLRVDDKPGLKKEQIRFQKFLYELTTFLFHYKTDEYYESI